MTGEFAAFFSKNLLDSTPISCKLIGELFHLDGKQLQVQYYTHLSDVTSWDQTEHATGWLLYADNIGPSPSMEETSLSQGELYTIVANKATKGTKAAVVAMVKGVQSESVIKVLRRILEAARNEV
jgi:hypothetical protein